MAYSVYCHTNKVNGKRYIGITKHKPEKRWANGYGYSNNRHFFSACMKADLKPQKRLAFLQQWFLMLAKPENKQKDFIL